MNDISRVREGWAHAPAPRATGLDVRVIAFYRPQFHPIEENDHWWGRGFTDWQHVARGRPLFEGHYQPRLPRELGFYDLRIDEVRRGQIELARTHGVYGFCYHYYWFGGRRILEQPLNRYLADPTADFPFCICWTNENWTRGGDGGNDQVLLAQEHDYASDMKFIREAIPLFKDPRYIRVDGRPLLVLYRADLLRNPKETAEGWRQACLKADLPGIHLCVAQTVETTDPREIGFDSACEFPPYHHGVSPITDKVEGLPAEFRGQVFDYETVARQSLTRPVPDYPLYRALFPGWDDSARKRLDATIFHNAAPDRYEYWLRGLVDYTQRNSRGDRRIIFVNAWNRWAEGAHLEPDLKHGTEYLQATQRALTTQTDPRQLVSLLTAELRTIRNRGQRERMAAYAREIGAQLGHLASTIEFFTEERQMVERLERERHAAVFHRHTLDGLFGAKPDTDVESWLESINGRPIRRDLVVDINNTAFIAGWMLSRGIVPEAETTERYILLKCVEDDTIYAAQFWQHTDRQDVAAAHPDLDERFTLNCAFELLFSFSRVPADTYLVGCGLAGADKAAYAWTNHRIKLVE